MQTRMKKVPVLRPFESLAMSKLIFLKSEGGRKMLSIIDGLIITVSASRKARKASLRPSVTTYPSQEGEYFPIATLD